MKQNLSSDFLQNIARGKQIQIAARKKFLFLICFIFYTNYNDKELCYCYSDTTVTDSFNICQTKKIESSFRSSQFALKSCL